VVESNLEVIISSNDLATPATSAVDDEHPPGNFEGVSTISAVTVLFALIFALFSRKDASPTNPRRGYARKLFVEAGL
jgi:hypothetical protein